jgi:PAS domain S-box-containing protein
MAAESQTRADGAAGRAGGSFGAESRAAAFTALLEGATDHAVFTLDLDNLITSWSAGARELFGWDEGEAVGRSGAGIFTPEDRARGEPEAEIDAALSNGRAKCDHWFVREGGTRFWGSGTLTPMRDQGGAAIGFVKVLRDLTEQRVEREQLAAQAEVLASVTDGFCALDRAGRFTYANASALGLWRKRADEVLGRYFPDLLPEAVVGAEAHAAYRRAAAERCPVHVEVRAPSSDRWHSVSVYPAAGGGVTAYFRDITDRKLAEAALQAGEERYRLAMRAIDAMVFDWDVPAGTVRRSEGLARLLGFDPAEAEPTAAWWTARVHPDDARNHDRSAERAMARGAERFEVEHRVLHRDGRWVDVLDTGYVLYGEDGRPLRAVGSSVDVTERRHAEAALRERNLRLEILAEAAARLIAGDGPDTAVGGLFRSVAERLGADVCFRFSADEATGALTLEDHVGVPEEAARGLARVEFGRTVCGVVAQLRQPAYVVDVQSSADPLTAYIRAIGVRAYASYPLLAGARLLGTLSFASRRRDRFDEEELAFFRTVSHHVAAAGERRRAEEALRESEERFRQFAEYSADVLWIADATAAVRLEYLSPAYERVWGEPREAVMSDLGHWAARVHPDDREAAVAGLPRLLTGGGTFVQDYRIVRPDGGLRWIRDTGFPIPDRDGTIRRVGGIARDVSDMKLHERRQDVLVAELQHRVKNILANVQSLARQTRGRSRTLDGFATAFGGRLDALARTQKLLTRTPEGRAGLRDIVKGELAAYDGDGSRAVIRGPDVTLGAAKAQSLQLAVHELVTNAAKYGAFATEEGRLEVAWEIDPGAADSAAGADLLRLRWRETGVRVADRAPARGFGSEIIEGSLPYMLGGTASLAFHPDGVECVVAFPLTRRGQDDDGET